MTPERDDPLIDAGLEELLGGQTPPDLSARILQTWSIRSQSSDSAYGGVFPEPLQPGFHAAEPPAPPLPAVHAAMANEPPFAGSPLVQLRTTPAATSVRRKSLGAPAAMTAVLALGLAVGVGALFITQQLGKPAIAVKPKHDASQGGKPAARNQASPPRAAVANANQKPLPKQSAPPAAVTHQPAPSIPADAAGPSPHPAAVAQASPNFMDPISSADSGVAGSSDEEILAFINAKLAQTWAENEVTPAAMADDAEWCRRLYLRVVGRIPTLEEAQQFLDDKSPDKRPRLVASLLSDSDYVEQYADHWSALWTNVLIGRTGGKEGVADRDGLQQYLAHSLANNKPYDRLVYELITATGSSTPGAADYNGAVNFLLAGAKDDAILATGRATRVFLGQQVQCAQCHHHPSADWTQHQFWALNSFFRQIRVVKSPEGARLVNADFASKTGSFDEAEVYYQQPNGELKAAYPQLPDGTTVSPSGLVEEVNRREELARWIVRSDDMPRALVNRLWSHFFGYGFTRPIDDMGQHNQPVHPEILERLAQEFVAHDYDLKKLIGWITRSDPFNRSSKIPSGSLAQADMPDAGTVPLFSHYYSRQMQAEEVYDSLLIAAKLRREASDTPGSAQAKIDWLAQFNRPMNTDDASEESHFNGSIRQSIIMMNGDLMQKAVSREHAGLLASVLRSSLKTPEKIEHLFLAALSRKPTKKELDAAQQIVAKAGNNEAQALEDIWWALLNSNEFILDH